MHHSSILAADVAAESAPWHLGAQATPGRDLRRTRSDTIKKLDRVSLSTQPSGDGEGRIDLSDLSAISAFAIGSHCLGFGL